MHVSPVFNSRIHQSPVYRSLSGISGGEVSTGALKFDGVNDYVRATTNISITSNQISVSVWVFVRDLANNPRIFELRDGSNSIQLLRDGATGLWATKHSQFQTVFNGTTWNTVVAGVWQHLVVIWDSVNNTTTFYVNGVSQSGVAFSNVGAGDQANTIYLGVRSDLNNTTPFNGYLDDVRIYNVALSAAQISAMYANTTPAPTSGLVGHWKLDDGSGTTAVDSSGNGNNGTLTNGPTWTTDVPPQLA